MRARIFHSRRGKDSTKRHRKSFGSETNTVSTAVSVVDPFGLGADEAFSCATAMLDPNEAAEAIRTASSDNRFSLPLIRIEVLRYKRGRRCLIEYEFEAAGG